MIVRLGRHLGARNEEDVSSGPGLRNEINGLGPWLSRLLLPCLVIGFVQGPVSWVSAEVDFIREIQPLLTQKCTQCHGGVKKKGGLSLSSRSGAFSIPESGESVIVPGDSDASELMARLVTDDEDDRMPPEEGLDPSEIDLFRRWINEGADWPEHWSRVPIKKVPLPAVDRLDWVRNEIDYFVSRRLELESILPSPEAEPSTLIRRLSLDLVGLLPEARQVQRFVEAWNRADAAQRTLLYEAQVDEFLNSPHFGERWGRHWLDEARYADSSGYEKDSTRSDAFRYRDWVIEAINDDMPFDEFSVRQIGGDLLPKVSVADRIATQFHLMCQFNLEGGVDAEEDRTKRVVDRVTTIGSIWLGTTIECARCHDHPYDPIGQRDFYKLYAFFNNMDFAAVIAGEAPRDADEKVKKREERWGPIQEMLEEQVTNKNLATKLQAALTTMRRIDNDEGFTRVVAERLENRRSTYVFHRGNFLLPDTDSGELAPDVPMVWPRVTQNGTATPNRLHLARWLFQDDHPLTARVTVNKVWLRLFGVPLVESVRDFGTRGKLPSHPQLLDWLAYVFAHEMDWSRKNLIRRIVGSATYRQSAVARSDLSDRDPSNRFLARQNRFRHEAEIVRDIFLQAGGLLDRTVGGPSVFPPVPADVAALSYANNFRWTTSEGGNRYRRGLYTFFKRTAPDPNLMTFDCPDASMTHPRRGTSNTPLQALATLQNEVFHEASQAFARRLLEAPEISDVLRLERAFQLAVGRTCDEEEQSWIGQLLSDARTYYAEKPGEAEALIGAYGVAGVSTRENAAWVAVGRIILNLDEFLTRS